MRFVELTRLVSFEQYRYVAPLVVETFVVLAATQGQAAHALRLAGAAAGLRRVLGAQFRLSWQQHVTRRLEPAWRALGEEKAKAAFEEGRTMTLEEAIAYALDEAAEGKPSHPSGGLSARELEVLRLAAEGMTDPRIAEKLYLSRRTVGHHLSAIYRKLGVQGRAAAVHKANELDLI